MKLGELLPKLYKPKINAVFGELNRSFEEKYKKINNEPGKSTNLIEKDTN